MQEDAPHTCAHAHATDDAPETFSSRLELVMGQDAFARIQHATTTYRSTAATNIKAESKLKLLYKKQNLLSGN